MSMAQRIYEAGCKCPDACAYHPSGPPRPFIDPLLAADLESVSMEELEAASEILARKESA